MLPVIQERNYGMNGFSKDNISKDNISKDDHSQLSEFEEAKYEQVSRSKELTPVSGFMPEDEKEEEDVIIKDGFKIHKKK